MYGSGDFLGGLATRRSPLVSVLAISQLVGLVVALVSSLALGTKLPGAADLAWGIAAGVIGTIGIAALYYGLATTIAAVVSPVAAVVGAVVPVALGVAAGERPGALAWAGISVALPSIVLLSAAPGAREGARGVRRAGLLGLAAGTGFGLFFFAISRTTPGSGLWPLAAARVATISLIGLFALASRRPLGIPVAALPVILASGALDMGANVAFLLASRGGMLSIVAAVAALYPGPTVVLSHLFLRERLTLPRIAGLALALTGVALISAG